MRLSQKSSWIGDFSTLKRLLSSKEQLRYSTLRDLYSKSKTYKDWMISSITFSRRLFSHSQPASLSSLKSMLSNHRLLIASQRQSMTVLVVNMSNLAVSSLIAEISWLLSGRDSRSRLKPSKRLMLRERIFSSRLCNKSKPFKKELVILSSETLKLSL